MKKSNMFAMRAIVTMSSLMMLSLLMMPGGGWPLCVAVAVAAAATQQDEDYAKVCTGVQEIMDQPRLTNMEAGVY
jgi:hypothetical protein